MLIPLDIAVKITALLIIQESFFPFIHLRFFTDSSCSVSEFNWVGIRNFCMNRLLLLHLQLYNAIAAGQLISSSNILTLREKCSNADFFLVRIFPHSD